MKTVNDFLKEINGGIERGAQAKLARDLGTSTSISNRYVKKILKPTEAHVKEMARKYKKTEKEIKDIFDIGERVSIRQHARHIHNGGGDQIIHHTDIEIFYEKFKTIEAKIDALKSLEAKMDLLLERVK
jgi:uncharacterized protein YaaN involved in tellurite resistance